MTPSSSPYAVFKAEEWVSDVAQPILIGQCLRLAPKKLATNRSSLKKKSCISLRKGFSSKHVQLAFAWYVNISVISATFITNKFLPAMFIVVLFFMEIIWFHVVISGCGHQREIGWCLEVASSSDYINLAVRDPMHLFRRNHWPLLPISFLY